MARTNELEVPVVAVTDKFDKKIAKVENQLNKIENKKVEVQADIDFKQEQLDRQIAKTDELADAYQRLVALKQKEADLVATPKDFEELLAIQNEYGNLQQIDNAIQKGVDRQDQLTMQIEKSATRMEELKQKAEGYKAEIKSIDMAKHKADIDIVKDGFKSVGSSVESIVNKVGRMALGIIGIRTALAGVRRASSELASYDKNYAANLEYIRFALTQAIAPVLRYIVSLAATLLGFINSILHALFGINIFSNASTKAFKDMKKGASGVSGAVGSAAKSAKELKKQLAGFDEANILQDNENTGGGRRRPVVVLEILVELVNYHLI